MHFFKVLPVVSLMMFSSVSFGAGMCSDLFSDKTAVADPEAPLTKEEENTLSEAAKISEEIEEQDGALKKIAIQHLYEKAVTFLQKNVTGTSIRSTEALKNRRKLQLIGFLKGGKFSEAINIYRHVFENVELSYHRINQDMGTLERLRAQPKIDKSDMANIQARLQVYQRRFAASYGEYVSVRTYLEKVGVDPATDAVTAEAAQKTLMFLGVHKFNEKNVDYKSLEIPAERPTLTEIKNLFRSKAQYTRMKLFSDFKAEVVTVLKFIFSSEIIIGTVDSIFNKFPTEASLKLKKFTGLMQTEKIRSRYLNVVIDIETLPQDSALRLEALRKKNASTPNDELLITYARTVDFSDSWNSLKESAKEKTLRDSDVIYKKFYDRMLEAEAKALKMGDISIFDKDSNIDNMIVVIQTGLILKYVGPSVFESGSELYGYVLTILGAQ